MWKVALENILTCLESEYFLIVITYVGRVYPGGFFMLYIMEIGAGGGPVLVKLSLAPITHNG